MTHPGQISADALRHAFDVQFAQPPPGSAEDREHFLGIRLGGRACAVPLLDVSGLEGARRIVPLPGTAPPLLGLSGIRGHLVPVYSLAGLLAHDAPDERPRWLLLTRGADLIGLAFTHLDGLLDVPCTARVDLPTAAPDDNALERRHLSGMVHTGSELRSILSIPSLVSALTARVHS